METLVKAMATCMRRYLGSGERSGPNWSLAYFFSSFTISLTLLLIIKYVKSSRQEIRLIHTQRLFHYQCLILLMNCATI